MIKEIKEVEIRKDFNDVMNERRCSLSKKKIILKNEEVGGEVG